MRFRDPDAGTLVKRFFGRRRYDNRMNTLLYVAYILAQLPASHSEVILGGAHQTLRLYRLVDDAGGVMYGVDRMGAECESLFSALYTEHGLSLEHTTGSWESDLELAYALVRDTNVLKIGAGNAAPAHHEARSEHLAVGSSRVG